MTFEEWMIVNYQYVDVSTLSESEFRGYEAEFEVTLAEDELSAEETAHALRSARTRKNKIAKAGRTNAAVRIRRAPRAQACFIRTPDFKLLAHVAGSATRSFVGSVETAIEKGTSSAAEKGASRQSKRDHLMQVSL
jgi:hypothetical protein